MEQNEFKKATVFNLNDTITYADGGIVSKTVLKKATGNVSLFAFGNKEGLSEHTAPFDALAFIIDGSAAITIGSNEFALKAGELIIMPAHIPHSVKAVTNFKMMLIMLRSSE